MSVEPSYLDELDPRQREAVTYTDGPSLVIAGAGAGKTRVLTYKIAHLLNMGMAPWNILALTFTNKAAKEMRERVGELIDPKTASRLWMGTFHSIFARILRREAETIGFSANFTIYDQNDSRSLLKSIIKEMGLDEKVYKPALVNSRISAAKNRLILPKTYMDDEKMHRYDAMNNLSAVGQIYEHYMLRCRKSNVLDFDDLLLYTYLLFSRNEDICSRYAENFHYVLVDEYQDTNYAQHAIIRLLTQGRQQLCVVGDDAQSIYSFRGAEIDNILQFSKLYCNTKLFKLEQNYRSTQSIVGAANDIIAYNQNQIKKQIFSENQSGDPIRIFQAYSDIEEAEIVCKKVSELKRREKTGFGQFAVLYRTNSQSRIFEEAMRKHSIPYRVYGGLSFYQRKEIKDVLAYFRLAINPTDEEALRRVINYPARGIGDTTVKKIAAAASDENVSMWDIVCAPEHPALNLSTATWAKLIRFREMIQNFNSRLSEENAYELGERIIRESGIMNDVSQDNSPENLSKQENIRELANAIHTYVAANREEDGMDFSGLETYMSQVALLSDQDTDDAYDEKVTLMTIHAAKGLEFNTVFIVGVEDNLFPNVNATASQRQMEEERRLFYVAITRAREHCYISYTKSRFRYGKMEFCSPSPFLREAMQSAYVRFTGIAEPSLSTARIPLRKTNLKPINVPTPPTKTSIRPSSATAPSHHSPLISAEVERLTEGCKIEHERFGIGTVMKVEGIGDNRKATVDFVNAGRKQLLLKYARITLIE